MLGISPYCWVAIALASLVGAYVGYAGGRRDGRARALRGLPPTGWQVEAHVKRGKDGRYGVSVGRHRPGQLVADLDTDWISTGGDRFLGAREARSFVRGYWPGAVIVERDGDGAETARH